jgi:hypothetical protein
MPVEQLMVLCRSLNQFFLCKERNRSPLKLSNKTGGSCSHWLALGSKQSFFDKGELKTLTQIKNPARFAQGHRSTNLSLQRCQFDWSVSAVHGFCVIDNR